MEKIDSVEKSGARSKLPLDMEALSAFNRALASGALAQLYLDGRRDEALAWAARLDVFESAKSQKGEGEQVAHGSLFDAALAEGDKAALEALENGPERRQAMYRIRHDAVARCAAKHAESNPDFGRWLVSKLDPLPKSDSGYSYRSSLSDHSALGSLASAACKHKRYEWLGALDALSRISEGEGLRAWSLLREHFLKDADAEGARALMALGEMPSDALREMAIRFCPCEEPGQATLWAELMALDFDARLAKSNERLGRAAQYAAMDARAMAARGALWDKPWETPAKWLAWHLDKGVDGFVHKAGSGLPVAVDALAGNWREGLDRWDRDGVPKLARAAQARSKRESELLPLVAMLADSAKEGLDAKIATAELPLGIKGAFVGSGGGSGARKVDALSLCVAQGYFRIADALVAKGADWRFASKQCSQWLAPVDKDFEGPEDHAMRQSYLEGLALREVSLRASAKKAKAALASAVDQRPAPAPRRL
jgi:hypothetical protein